MLDQNYPFIKGYKRVNTNTQIALLQSAERHYQIYHPKSTQWTI